MKIDEAEIQGDFRPGYLTSFRDHIHSIMKTNPDQDTQSKCKLFESEWKKLDDKYGVIDETRLILTMDEWRDRKILILVFIGAIGMGASLVSGKELPDPMAMWKYHECPENCPILVDRRQRKARYE